MSKFGVTILDDVHPGTPEWNWCESKKFRTVPSARDFSEEMEKGKEAYSIKKPWFIVFSERQQRFCAILNRTYISWPNGNYHDLREKMAEEAIRDHNGVQIENPVVHPNNPSE